MFENKSNTKETEKMWEFGFALSFFSDGTHQHKHKNRDRKKVCFFFDIFRFLTFSIRCVFYFDFLSFMIILSFFFDSFSIRRDTMDRSLLFSISNVYLFRFSLFFCFSFKHFFRCEFNLHQKNPFDRERTQLNGLNCFEDIFRNGAKVIVDFFTLAARCV